MEPPGSIVKGPFQGQPQPQLPPQLPRDPRRPRDTGVVADSASRATPTRASQRSERNEHRLSWDKTDSATHRDSATRLSSDSSKETRTPRTQQVSAPAYERAATQIGLEPTRSGPAPAHAGSAPHRAGPASDLDGPASSRTGPVRDHASPASYRAGTAPARAGTAPARAGTASARAVTAPTQAGSVTATKKPPGTVRFSTDASSGHSADLRSVETVPSRDAVTEIARSMPPLDAVDDDNDDQMDITQAVVTTTPSYDEYLLITRNLNELRNEFRERERFLILRLEAIQSAQERPVRRPRADSIGNGAPSLRISKRVDTEGRQDSPAITDTEDDEPTYADRVRRSPPPPSRQKTTSPPLADTPATTKKSQRYPPLIVENLPNWCDHFKKLRHTLGRNPSARPFGKGFRFIPTDESEYRTVQRYLSELERTSNISWFSYSLPSEQSVKVAIRGLPADTDVDLISEDLKLQGFEPEYIRPIKARRGRPGCIFLAILRRTPDLKPRIFEVNEILCMPGIIVEPWRGKKGPSQCHRCQKFRHSSHNCHRRQACVRCGEEHSAHECPRPLEDPATCANCHGPHPANYASCPEYRREARNKRAGTTAETAPARLPKTKIGPEEAPAPVEHTGPTNSQGSNIRTPANEPTVRGLPPKRKAKKPKKPTNKNLPPTTVSTDNTVKNESPVLDMLFDLLKQALAKDPNASAKVVEFLSSQWTRN